MQKDMWFTTTTRVAGVERTTFSNEWMTAQLSIEPSVVCDGEFAWSVVVEREDFRMSTTLNGSGKSRTHAKAQAVNRLTSYIKTVVENNDAYIKRKALYDALSVKAGVSLAVATPTPSKIKEPLRGVNERIEIRLAPDNTIVFGPKGD